MRTPGPIHSVKRLPSLAVAMLLLAGAASAQESALTSPEPAAPPAAARPVAAPSSGLFETIGRWFGEGATEFRNHIRGAKQRFDSLGDDAARTNREITDKAVDVGKGAVEITKDAVEVTKDAVGTVVKLPATRVMQGHERCAVAPNGAPNCIAAAEALCRKHGFSTGKSLDFTSAEDCPVEVRLSGRRSDADCKTVTFISRAVCQ